MINAELTNYVPVLFYISEWLVRLIMLVIVIERHPLRAAMTWLLVIFFLPWPGLLLYLFLGENRLPLRRLKKRKQLQNKLNSIRNRYVPTDNCGTTDFHLAFHSTVALAENLGEMPILFGNDVTLLSETDTFISQIIKDINNAKTHVHLLFYIFEMDETGFRIIHALELAVKRGVKCRLLVDDQGSRRLVRKMSAKIRSKGIEFYAVLSVNILRAWASRIDLRNHRKIAVIDGVVAYTGSQNIVNAGYGHKNLRWYDLMARIQGPVVLQLQAVFVGDWYAESDELLHNQSIFPENSHKPEKKNAVQVLPSGPMYSSENYQRVVIDALYQAKTKVVITTPYFIPDESFLQALETAALKGVKVILITPLDSDQKLVDHASCSYYERLLIMGIEIYRYKTGLLHVKSMVIDDSLAFLGSSNFDIRSFSLNFEINIIFYGKEVAEALYCLQQKYIAGSEKLSLEQWRTRSHYQKVMQSVSKLMSPLL